MWTSAPPRSSRRHFFSGRRLDQRRPAKEDRAGAADDDRLVRHRRHVRAAGRARSHHHRDLRNALGRHARLVEEDAAEVVAVGEDLGLQRQEGAAGIDQVDAGQPVLQRDLLGADMLLDGQRIVRAPLDCRVVGDDEHLASRDAADPRHEARRRRLVVVEIPGGQRRTARERETRGRAAPRCARGPAACPARGAVQVLLAAPGCARTAVRSRSSATSAVIAGVVSLRDEVFEASRCLTLRLMRSLPAAAVRLVATTGAAPDGVHPEHLRTAALASTLSRPRRRSV